MSDSRNAREVNLFGAVTLAIVDRMRATMEAAAGRRAAGPAALVALHEFAGGASMDDLRQILGLTPSGAVRLVDRMAADGYVERRPGTNGRSLALALTPAGRRVARRVLAARAASLEAVLSELTATERAALARINEKVIRAITRERLAMRSRGNPPAGGWLCRLCDHDACGRDRGTCPAAEAARAVAPADLAKGRGE